MPYLGFERDFLGAETIRCPRVISECKGVLDEVKPRTEREASKDDVKDSTTSCRGLGYS